MEVLDWLNENELRGYPLLEDADKRASNLLTYTLPDAFILDLLLVSTVPIVDEIMLTYVGIAATRTVTVEFSTGDIFAVEDVDNATYPVYVRLASGSLAVFGAGLKSLPIGSMLLSFSVPVEPCCTAEFCNAWLGVDTVSISPGIATYQSVGYKPLLDGDAGLVPFPLFSPQLSGNVQFRAGYNFRVGISNNLVDLQVGGGLGLKISCLTPFVSKSVKDCDKIISYINGKPPNASSKFALAAGNNISIIDGVTLQGELYDKIDPTISAKEHTLFVGLSFLQTDICDPINLSPVI